jgi:outer membrane lipoprotein LolB
MVLLLAAACVSRPTQLLNPGKARDASELTHWIAKGRIGVSGVEQSGSGGFTWTQQAERSSVQVQGPLGTGTLQMEFDGRQLSLHTADGAQYDADQALTELQARLGVAVPISELRYWLVGLAAPGNHAWSGTDNSVLEQSGWHIVYGPWLQQDTLGLPGKLVLTHDQLRIVMVVQQWQLNQP